MDAFDANARRGRKNPAAAAKAWHGKDSTGKAPDSTDALSAKI
jgi:hypothetical protein